ncbi:hypothetical protein BLNAU_4535 [Blattamonas nauphoetae]|uniref:Uncharacterized protein n=1 Tax=Blattamonas nauphoetae TaxID=2049346 RepID=A0ABQ9Y9J4_9EUKA|nr:hypothetical protein BLNAU_4535 [Blattamonas nauphoetae]
MFHQHCHVTGVNSPLPSIITCPITPPRRVSVALHTRLVDSPVCDLNVAFHSQTDNLDSIGLHTPPPSLKNRKYSHLSKEEPVEGLLISLHSSISQTKLPKSPFSHSNIRNSPNRPLLDSQTLSHAQTSPDLLVLMFEYSFGLQTQEVVELLTFKPFELQLLFEFVDEEQYQTHSISSSILFLNHSEEIVKLCGDDSTTISFIAQILTLSITNSSDIVAEYSSAGQITFSESMLELDKTNEVFEQLWLKKTEEHTHKLVSTAIQSSLTLDSIPEKYESLFVLSVPLLQRSISFLLHLWTVFASLVEGNPQQIPRLSLFQFLLSLSDVPETEVLTSYTLSSTKEGVSAPSHLLDSLLTATPVFLFCPLHSSAMEIGEQSVWAGEVDLLKRKQRQAKDKRRKIHTRRKEEKNKRQMVANQKKEDEDATAQPDEMEQNQECPSSQHTPGLRLSTKHPLSSPIHTDISHHTPCHSNHNVQSPPDFDAEWHLVFACLGFGGHHCVLGGWMENEKGGKQNEFELMTQHIGLVIVNSLVGMNLLSFIRKEMKTRTIKLVTLNPTRIVDNAQSELIVVFFPPLCSTGLDETKRAPNAFEMSVVGFDEFSIEPLFVTAGETSML